MPLTVVVGGQFGGEGKGAVAAYLTKKTRAAVLVKTGGPNASHTFGVGGRLFRLRMVPSGAKLGPRQICFPAGSLIHPPTLFSELGLVGFTGRVCIDPHAGIVTADHAAQEKVDPRYAHTGSTYTGTSVALALRAQRRLTLAKDEESLAPFLTDVAELLHDQHRAGEEIIVEGAQAFGLSNFHGHYPFVTGRDTTAAAALSEVGLGSKYLDAVVLVLKAFPTRNRIGAGPLPNELTDAGLVNRPALVEYGGGDFAGGDQQRRVGLFDFAQAARATRANSPSSIALTGMDRLRDLIDHPVIREHYGSLASFSQRVGSTLGVPVGIEGWGPYLEDIVDHTAPR